MRVTLVLKAALALLSCTASAAPAMAALIGSCSIVILSSGMLAPNPQINTLSSAQGGGTEALVSVTSHSLTCVVPNLADCWVFSAPAPHGFLAAPPNVGSNISFATTYSVDGMRHSGEARTALSNTTRVIPIGLTATKTSGVLPAGAYQAEVTVRCE